MDLIIHIRMPYNNSHDKNKIIRELSPFNQYMYNIATMNHIIIS